MKAWKKGGVVLVLLKNRLKQLLVNRQNKKYSREVEKREIDYDQWIRKGEKSLARFLPGGPGQTVKMGEMTFAWIAAEEMTVAFEEVLKRNFADIFLLTFYPGKISAIAIPLLYQQFKAKENVLLIYGDEDSLESEKRTNPWFKPDWSPDTFLSSFYFGGLVAVRREALKEARLLLGKRQEAYDGREDFFYHLFFTLLRENGGFLPGHIQESLPICHIPHILFHCFKTGEEIRGKWQLKLPEEAEEALAEPEEDKDTEKTAGLSIIIPSKDNPTVLFQCLDSLLYTTKTGCFYEILIIDNGSRIENKELIQGKVDSLNEMVQNTRKQGWKLRRIRYHYEPMPFNFSRMCNLGAGLSQGKVLLFLNDDMEIIQPDWMDLLLKKVRLSYVGAVGAKLLYPQSRIIQHAGITNLRVGPAHKLQFLDDENEYYFGKNRGVHNMLAVTGACLMVRREIFDKVGGFAEILAVAFNDVDLCYSIYEAGYYNVVRNDVVLYHHESLSRGDDGESVEKQMRLQKEKDILYRRHQKLYGKDPYYSPFLATDVLKSEYVPALYHETQLEGISWSVLSEATNRVKKAREDRCLMVGMECVTDIYKWRFGISAKEADVVSGGEDEGYYVQGYAFVIGGDNACYRMKLLVKHMETGQVLATLTNKQYRPQMKREIPDQRNVELTGYAVKIKPDQLRPGIYRFGMLAEDTCSRQRLVNWTNWVLEVTEMGVARGGEMEC